MQGETVNVATDTNITKDILLHKVL